jgi:LytR cell envelope-related transcriptional attenuator
MTSLRESPIRRQRPGRPTWLVALLVVVGLLVVIGVGYGVVSLVRGSSGSPAADAADPAPSPCVTTVVTPAEVLPTPAKVKVNVYNATATSGLASKTANELEGRGFRVGRVANDPVGKPIPGVAEIRFGAKGAQGAELLLLYVPGAELVALDRKGRNVDLAMGTGFTGLAPQPEVVARLASPSPVASGPGCPSEAPGASSAPTPTP